MYYLFLARSFSSKKVKLFLLFLDVSGREPHFIERLPIILITPHIHTCAMKYIKKRIKIILIKYFFIRYRYLLLFKKTVVDILFLTLSYKYENSETFPASVFSPSFSPNVTFFSL